MILSVPVVKYPRLDKVEDSIVIERPLQIDLIYGEAHHRRQYRLASTMRTPGADRELVLGFLFSLGIIDELDDVLEINPCPKSRFIESDADLIVVLLNYSRVFIPAEHSFGHMRYSACGLCASSTLPKQMGVSPDAGLKISARLILASQGIMKQQQQLFAGTGGSHAAALFAHEGELLALHEDIGRHNALDKLIGSQLIKGTCSFLPKTFLLMSSRASYELIQKAARAAIPLVVAVGAISSEALKLAKENGITLVGFLRQDRMNVYCHEQRIIDE